MARKIEEIELDSNHGRILKGFQNRVYSLGVAAMIEGIRVGKSFSPVDVVENNGRYEMLYVSWSQRDISKKDGISIENYGGHHRAVAHYIAGVPLKIRIHDYHYLEKVIWPLNVIRKFFPDSRISVSKICFIDGRDPVVSRAITNLPYRVAKRFCMENNLDVAMYLPQ